MPTTIEIGHWCPACRVHFTDFEVPTIPGVSVAAIGHRVPEPEISRVNKKCPDCGEVFELKVVVSQATEQKRVTLPIGHKEDGEPIVVETVIGVPLIGFYVIAGLRGNVQ